MLTYKEIPIGPEADEYWWENLLYVSTVNASTWFKDVYTPYDIHRAPTQYGSTVKYTILVED